MFEVDDELVYVAGSAEVIVKEVWDRHIIVMSVDTEEVFPVYDDEYSDYEKAGE